MRRRVCRKVDTTKPSLVKMLTPGKRLLTPLKYHVFENIMENGAFALKEQMLHFHNIFKSIQTSTEFFQCCLKIENDVMI